VGFSVSEQGDMGRSLRDAGLARVLKVQRTLYRSKIPRQAGYMINRLPYAW
jgi:hypothetical protein